MLGGTISAGMLLAAPAGGWWPEGHSTIARAAVQTLPAEVPSFFREGGAMIGHCAQDPDVHKQREAPNATDAEGPEHYLDWELLKGKPLPAKRSQFYRLLGELKEEPGKVGTLPYSITEWTERLAITLAEHRKWPENPTIKAKALVYAGFLAHYAGDLSMPLHTTVHHDGRTGTDGETPRSGIHAKVDSLIERLELKSEELSAGQKAEAYPEILPAVQKEMLASHALVDRVYALEPKLPPREGAFTAAPEVREFTTERARAGTRFLGSLYLTAWKKSATINLPAWLKREPR